jgi:hypothetical protein
VLKLGLYDQMRIAIQRCAKIDEAAAIRDKGAQPWNPCWSVTTASKGFAFSEHYHWQGSGRESPTWGNPGDSWQLSR